MTDRNGRLCALFDGLATRVRSADLRSIGFTGSIHDEGASTLALGTALSLATLDPKPVLLVDANWLRPSLTADAGAGSRPGLADVLRDESDLRSVSIATGRARLSFVPAGNVGVEPPLLDGLPRFLENAQSDFGRIVVDLPPALVGEAVVLPWAAALQQLFVVVRNGVTPLALVRRTIDEVALEQPQVVLNRTTVPGAGALAMAEATP